MKPSSSPARTRGPQHVGADSAGDPYTPTSGNGGYRVDHYDLDLDYRVATNRLAATATITATATEPLDRFTFDLHGLSVDQVHVDGARARKATTSTRKLTITAETTIDDGATFQVVVKYHGTPRPIRTTWGTVGWEELTDGVIVASQPTGAPSWYPCDDRPDAKATYDIRVACEPGYHVVANGVAGRSRTASSRVHWTFRVD